MIKRIVILFVITGSGYVFSILALKYLARFSQVNQIAGIAELESLIQLLIGVIGFGMQTEAIRNISFSENWRKELIDAQKARITLSFLLLLFCFFGFYNNYYFYFLVAPFLAYSIDYALYARGFPVIGSLVSLIRVIVPLLVAVFSVYASPDLIFIAYAFATVIVYTLTNLGVSLYLEVPLIYAPSFHSLKLYFKTIPLGIINLCFYFFGLGILLIAQLFFDQPELVIAFLGLKFYLIYKSALRVLHQAFINRMKEEQVCLSIDKISIMMSIGFLGSIIIYPLTFISIFFGEQYLVNKQFFILIGMSAVSFSLFSSSTTRVLLERKDVEFIKIALVSVFFSIVIMVLAQSLNKKAEIISASLLGGEVFFAIALAYSFFNRVQIKERLFYLFKCSLGLVIPYCIKVFFCDNLLAYIVAFSLLGILLLLFSYKSLALPVSHKV